jgi:hypothetical protein
MINFWWNLNFIYKEMLKLHFFIHALSDLELSKWSWEILVYKPSCLKEYLLSTTLISDKRFKRYEFGQTSGHNDSMLPQNYLGSILNCWYEPYLWPVCEWTWICLFVCLLVCQPLEQFFCYLVAVTTTDDKAANSYLLCSALMTFNSEGSFTCHTCCNTGLSSEGPALKSHDGIRIHDDIWITKSLCPRLITTTPHGRLNLDLNLAQIKDPNHATRQIMCLPSPVFIDHVSKTFIEKWFSKPIKL